MNDKEFDIINDIMHILANIAKEMEVIANKFEELTNEQIKQKMELEQKINREKGGK